MPSFIMNVLPPWTTESEMFVALYNQYPNTDFHPKRTNKGYHIISPNDTDSSSIMTSLKTIKSQPFKN